MNIAVVVLLILSQKCFSIPIKVQQSKYLDDRFQPTALPNVYIDELSNEDTEFEAGGLTTTDGQNDNKQNAWELSGKFEGDIVLPNSNFNYNGLINNTQRWNNLEIPYDFDPIFDKEHRDWIESALQEYRARTCIKPRPRNPDDEDYVYITGKLDGCYTTVGRQGGKQKMNLKLNTLGRGCFQKGTIVHEFLHALGFYHQQSAHNRDDHIFIVYKHIKDDALRNFAKFSKDHSTSFGEPYDYESIMHYSAYAFTKNGRQTIIPNDPNAMIGQRIALSEIDIRKLHKMYGCPI